MVGTSEQQRVAVVQPLPGIGDMIWHIQHIRALARHLGAPVTLIAKSSTLSEQLFAGDPAVRAVVRVSRDARGARYTGWELLPALIGRRFRRVYLLHHSRGLAFAIAMAGVRERFGYGFGGQRPFLNRGPFLPASVKTWHPFELATMYLQILGVPLPDPEPRLDVPAEARVAARARLGVADGPFVVLGIGSSQPSKQWGAAKFAALARILSSRGWPNVVLLAGPGEAGLAAEIRAALGPDGPRAMDALGWDLPDAAAVCAEAAFYVGNDTAALNLAAAVGTRSFGLFGSVAPFGHAGAIVPIVPPDGVFDWTLGVARIDVAQVVGAIGAAVR
jgi:heptosyltransferase-2